MCAERITPNEFSNMDYMDYDGFVLKIYKNIFFNLYIET